MTVLDPAIGHRKLPIPEVSREFSGVALELTPGARFSARKRRQRISLRQLTGTVQGLPRALALVLVVALVLEVFAVGAPLLNQLIVDEAIAAHDLDMLNILALGFALLLLVQTVLAATRSWMVLVLGQTLSLQWSGNVFSHLLRLPLDWFERRHLGDIVSRFGSVKTIQQTLTTAFIEGVLDGVMVIVALVLMLLFSPALTCVVAGAVAAHGLVRWAAYGPALRAAGERLAISAREQTHFFETVRAMGPLKLFGREEARRASWQNLVVDMQNRDVRIGQLTISTAAANGLIFGLENLTVLWLASRLVMSTGQPGAAAAGANFSIGMMFAFVAYKTQFTQRVVALIGAMVQLRMLGMHSERLADIALSAPERDTRQGNQSANDLAHLPPTLALRSVGFRYSATEPWILRRVDVTLNAGEVIAIVGASGAGKTTLARILVGLLMPTEGEVTYGGMPVRQLGIANVRACLGAVMQDDVLLSGDLGENIAFFDPEPDLVRIEAAARSAQLHPEIVQMPMGYRTRVGDLGSGLSGGQKQRLLLARALYRRPTVLVLDEATSHLDVANERAITAELAAMQVTRIVIAHRPETIAAADRVYEVRGGRLHEMVRKTGRSSAIAEMQAEESTSDAGTGPQVQFEGDRNA